MSAGAEFEAPWYAWTAFVAIVLALLVTDLLLFRGQHIGVRKSLMLTAGYVAAAVVFGLGLAVVADVDTALSFFTGFALEKGLSLDNIFVFVVIFRAFRVPDKERHTVLVWGVLSALLMRGAFIAVGVTLIRNYEWVMLIFGALLVWSGMRLFLRGGLDNARDPKQSRVYRFAERKLNVTRRFHGHRFFVKRDGEIYATPLLTTLVVVEATDLVFAIDSIPAIFSVTQDPFIVFTSNVFALLGLRALYFALHGVIERFRYLKPALSLLLVIIGVKIFTSEFVAVPVWATLAVTFAVIGGGVGLSLTLPRGDAARSRR
ncbi:MAG: TerC/Alx family metal homeostasis membrane protein [Alphaproteobacteria bacterium]|nr:TerC/Alx family metal homeostasis membrane protein [Alphaproteobacteria bacterium]